MNKLFSLRVEPLATLTPKAHVLITSISKGSPFRTCPQTRLSPRTPARRAITEQEALYSTAGAKIAVASSLTSRWTSSSRVPKREAGRLPPKHLTK